ncbi:hypothetical protein AB1A81_11745 [Bdellovibrio bacteriovorus]|uniref:Uncharacterized protein n=1 Tax=Bdellovibrio bacteriovorus (strain ATCC 15356 / DSM 50701 / NCIMB 9529 / HD100) TaxID=264462 RepID=Q6MK49_BDEBA|nr:hypothetical protein [Bdellovibrio bacteriovorus]CAE80360.1 hypothetical protein predicted by Glimmer/Critica [Bdellovibrio bacteriovorus HD100]
MKVSHVLFFILAPAALQAETLTDGRPKDCSYSASVNGVARTLSVACNDFDLNYKKNYGGACVYKDGSWQYGNLMYDAKASKHKFVARRVCDIGVVVVPPADTLNIKSPRIGDYLEGKTQIVSLTKKVYTSHLASSPLKASESPILCYRKESRGVAMNGVACSREPNDPNYCEFAATPSKSYKGNWWMQYRGKNKTSPVICLGGVKSTDANEAAETYSENQLLVKVSNKNKTDLLKDLSLPAVGEDNLLDFKIASCSITDKKTVRVTCLNQEDAGFDVWEDNSELVKSQLTSILGNNKGLHTKETKASLLERDLRNPAKLKSLTAERIAAMEAELSQVKDAIVDLKLEIAEEVDQKIATLRQANGEKVPVRQTPAILAGHCHIDWSPAMGLVNGKVQNFADNDRLKGAYVYYKKSNSKTLDKIYCDSVEVVQKTEIQAAK